MLTCLMTLSDSGLVALMNSWVIKECTPWPVKDEKAAGGGGGGHPPLPSVTQPSSWRTLTLEEESDRPSCGCTHSPDLLLLVSVIRKRRNEPQIIPTRKVKRYWKKESFLQRTILLKITGTNRHF